VSLKSVESLWENNAKKDALWSILSYPGKVWQGEKEIEEFFDSGQHDIDRYMTRLDQLSGLPTKDQALDFGCGVGRLSRALSRYFNKVVGIDISSSMIDKARTMNQQFPQCHFYKMGLEEMSQLPAQSFDFILSLLVLQHMPQRFAYRYIQEFLRLAKPGAVIIFQAPTHRVLTARNLLRSIVPHSCLRMRRQLLSPEMPYIPMYGLGRENVVTMLESCQAELLDLCWDDLAGPDWHSMTYYCRKNQVPAITKI